MHHTDSRIERKRNSWLTYLALADTNRAHIRDTLKFNMSNR